MSKRITLDNLKTFLTQLKTHITDPIESDITTLNVRIRNTENNIQTANSNIANVQKALNDIDKNKFAYSVNAKKYINNPEILTFVDTDQTQMKFKKSGLYKITVTKANNKASGISFCDTSLDFETKGNVMVGYNVGLYQPITSSLVMYIDKTKTYEFFGFVTGTYQGATTYTKQRGSEFNTNLIGSNIVIEIIKEC